MRQGILLSLVAVATIMMIGCSKKDNPVAPPASDANVPLPTGVTSVFTEGFGADLSKWASTFMLNSGDYYSPMRISTDASHTGTHSITSDSDRTALAYIINPMLKTGTVGVQFYIMAKSAGSINFTVGIGQNAGSSGGLAKQFGFGFDTSNYIKCLYYDSYNMFPENDSMIAPIQAGHWYKCDVEVDFTGQNIFWYLDGVLVMTRPVPTGGMSGIDRLLIFRGMDGAEGPKPYFADDIVVYTK
jgi:hypothetical protein